MKCPACGRALPPGSGACTSCGALAGLPVQGALAPDPATLQRDSGGKRRRERHWQDEVRERMDRRRQREGAGPREASPAQSELPLFGEPAPPAHVATPAPRARERALVAPAAPEVSGPQSLGPTELGPEPEAVLPLDVRRMDDDGETILRRASEPESLLAPLPLRSQEEPVLRPEPTRSEAWPLGEDSQPVDGEDEWALGEAHGQEPAALVDRPARPLERLQAALVDLGVLAALWAGVLYFAGRAARVPLSGLQPTWPWLLGYMGLLGLLYAAYFTGTTGQTLGKMLFSLRVIGRTGRGPGYAAALGRATLGVLGAGLAGLGFVPMVFDPARRALHDRVFSTRVVRPAPPTARLS